MPYFAVCYKSPSVLACYCFLDSDAIAKQLAVASTHAPPYAGN